MLNGVFDYKRFRKTPLPQPQPHIFEQGPKGSTGPTGIQYNENDLSFGATGTTGAIGLRGPTGTFFGQAIYENLVPEKPNQICFGSTANPFSNIFVEGDGRFGNLEIKLVLL